jgi:hypothetical protein
MQAAIATICGSRSGHDTCLTTGSLFVMGVQGLSHGGMTLGTNRLERPVAGG